MMQWIRRFGYGLCFALPLMMVTFALAQAAAPVQVGQETEPDCATCHPAFQDAWSAGAHGQATDDPAFTIAWGSAGKPKACLTCHVTGFDPINNTWEADGVSCQACHNPIPNDHPTETMPTDRTGGICGDCHVETYFEWQASSHHEMDLTCSGCHDPHQTSLKEEDAAGLCASCHKERSSNFTHTTHSQEGDLACDDCHMAEQTVNAEGGHSKRDHSFFVSLESCNNCHVYQMHDPVDIHTDQQVVQAVDAMAAVEALPVTAEPVPVSPLGFTLLAGLVGIAFGIIVAPMVDKMRRKEEEN